MSAVASLSTGHRLHPHTADLVLEVWGPTRPDALAEAVRALGATYAEPRTDRRETISRRIRETRDAELLVALLDETIFLVDVEGRVAVDARVEPVADGVVVDLTTVAVADVDQVGSVPKGVSRGDMEAGPVDGGWLARVTVDV